MVTFLAKPSGNSSGDTTSGVCMRNLIMDSLLPSSDLLAVLTGRLETDGVAISGGGDSGGDRMMFGGGERSGGGEEDEKDGTSSWLNCASGAFGWASFHWVTVLGFM